MYKVKICIDTDGDFGYEEPEFQLKDDREQVFYFENRADAGNTLVQSFHNLKKYLRPCGRDNIKNWINSMDKRIELITKKIPSFVIDKCFGNQSILYELVETERIEMKNGGYTFHDKDVDINFSWYEEEDIYWKKLVDMPDV